jgi:hypothetical protein
MHRDASLHAKLNMVGLGGVAWLLLTGMLLAEPARDGGFDDNALYSLLVKEVAATLEKGGGMALLPRNIQNVVIGMGGEPCFVVPVVDQYRAIQMKTTIDRIKRHEPGFRILWEAAVLGRDGDRSMLIAAGDRGWFRKPEADETAVMVEPNGTRPVRLPEAVAFSQQSIRSGTGWVFLTDKGVVASGEKEPWPGSEVFGRGSPARVFSSGENGFVMVSMTRPPSGPHQCLIGVSEGGKWSVQTLPVSSRNFAGTVVRRADGRFLEIGQRIIELDAERPSKPPEAELQAAVDAARAGDSRTFLEKLERVSSYPLEDLAGLLTLLAAIPADGEKVRGLRGQLDQMRRTLAALTVPGGLEPAEAARVEEVLSTASQRLEKAIAAGVHAEPPSLAQSRATALQQLRTGMQRYRGQWIRVNEVLHQDAIDSALLVVSTCDEKTGSLDNAIVRLAPDGALQPVLKLSGRWTQGRPWQSDAAGNVYGVIPGKGLARFSNGMLEVIGTSDRLKGRLEILGIDRHGRVYLRENRSGLGVLSGWGQELLWVFADQPAEAAAVPASEPPRVTTWPIVGQPAADADGSIWFFRRPEPRGRNLESAPAAQLTDDAGTTTTVTLEDDSPTAMPRGPVSGMPGIGQFCRLHAPTAVTEFSDLRVPDVNGLAAGRSAAWIVGSRGPPPGELMFIDGKSVRRASDMHAMARQHFQRLLEAAPSSIMPGAWCGMPIHHNAPSAPQILRTGDRLWVNAGGQVEVYAEGRPLSIGDRLTLLVGKIEQPRLIGPLDRGDGRKSVLVLAAPQMIDKIAWITPTDDGLTIELTETPSREWQGGSLSSPGSFTGLPLVADDASWLVVNNGFGRVWRIPGPKQFIQLPDAGIPILAVPKSDAFLAWRVDRVRLGIRVCSATKRRDVPITFTKSLEPAVFLEDGRLLCLHPEGLAWLEPDEAQGYVLGETLRVPHGLTPLRYVGAVGESIVITASTPGLETCLVSIPVAKPAR